MMETDGKLMWITFESPDNKNQVETFEIFDIAPMKEETGAPGKSSEGAIESTETKEGTGFFVTEHGHIITNAHVVSGGKQIQTRDKHAAHLIDKDDKTDLALLKIEVESPAVATFRLQPQPRIEDSIITFGYPLQGVLSSEGNLSTGTVSATTGVGDDPRFLQLSAPVQSGNSGSPLLDLGGAVIGVVEAKLDAVASFQITGDIPENVDFAIRASEATQFLERNQILYQVESSGSLHELRIADVAARAKQFSLPIECVE